MSLISTADRGVVSAPVGLTLNTEVQSMSMAVPTSTTPTRRVALGLSAAAIVAGFTAPAIAIGDQNSDAELIRICHQFAEAELASWYRDVASDEWDEDEGVDWDTYHQILATPATTPEGWHAKALACSAFAQSTYDDHESNRDSSTTFLASLLRDMVAPARKAIISRCAAKYGLLSSHYTADGIFVGPSPEEQAEMARVLAERNAARIAAVVAEHKGAQPPITGVPGQELIGVDEAGNMSLWCTGAIEPRTVFENTAGHPDYIKGGHYVIWWKQHQITVHCNGRRAGLVEVMFMCGGGVTRMMCDEVEALLIGQVVEDGGITKDKMADIIKEAAKALREARLAEAPSRRRGHISERAVA
jgi:hypothetical protein